MTEKEKLIYQKAQKGETMWIVRCFMYHYYHGPIIVVGFGAVGHESGIAFLIENSFTGGEESVYAEEIYLDEKEAFEAAQKKQEENGSVIISQKEYNEFLTWKKSKESTK